MTKFRGEIWCPFHLPLVPGEKRRFPSGVPARFGQLEELAFETFDEWLFEQIEQAKKTDGITDLSGVVFTEPITFEHYGGEDLTGLLFGGATFGDDAFFRGDPTRDRANIFPGIVDFRGATFKRRAVFNDRRFLHSTDFRGATFSLAPEFHNAVLHQDTRFSGARLLDRKGTDEVDAASAYRTLKLAMASVRATDEEARFYGCEQQSLRARRDTPRSVKLFSWLYEKTADYGQSFMRPVLCLTGTFGLFWLVYVAALVGVGASWVDVLHVLRFARQQVFQPFSAFRTGAVVPGAAGEAVPLGLAFLGALHSLLTFSFLALFLLALRRRFRLT